MTREEATRAAAERQQRDPAGKWVAVERGQGWTVARIGVPAESAKATSVAVTPKPGTPHDKPFSELDYIVRHFGGG